MQDNLLQQGFELMLYGMLFVFAFLLILIAVMMLAAKIIQCLPVQEEPVLARPRAMVPPQPAVPVSMPDERVLSVIKAAVHQHRTRG